MYEKLYELFVLLKLFVYKDLTTNQFNKCLELLGEKSKGNEKINSILIDNLIKYFSTKMPVSLLNIQEIQDLSSNQSKKISSKKRSKNGSYKFDIFEKLNSDKKDVINLYLSGKSIVDYLSKESFLCNSIEKKIIFKQHLGSGVYGSVYSISFNNLEIKGEYVVKVLPLDFYKQKLSSYLILGRIDKSITKNFEITSKELAETYKDEFDPDLFIAINGGPNKIFKLNDNFVIPEFGRRCLIKKENIFKKIGFPNETIRAPKNSYLCQNETYSEYMISLLVSEIYFYSEKCINFIGILDMITCSSLSYQFIFMEKIDDDLSSAIWERKLNQGQFDYLMIQYFVAVALYQKLEIVHGDTHSGNLFLSKITKNQIWKKTKLLNVEVFEYKVDGYKFYIPNLRVILKIGDWGFACKYSHPEILNYGILSNTRHGKVPNFFNLNYDILRTLIEIYKNELKILQNNPSYKLLSLKYINIIKDAVKVKSIEELIATYFDTDLIPIVKFLDKIPINPKTFLFDPNLFKTIYIKPTPNTKICRLGEIK